MRSPTALGLPTARATSDTLEPLRQAIRKKNELFFHRWRPQNETYLFGFRKHEQGKNAKEIAEFDPLVARPRGDREVRRSELTRASPGETEDVNRSETSTRDTGMARHESAHGRTADEPTCADVTPIADSGWRLVSC